MFQKLVSPGDKKNPLFWYSRLAVYAQIATDVWKCKYMSHGYFDLVISPLGNYLRCSRGMSRLFGPSTIVINIWRYKRKPTHFMNLHINILMKYFIFIISAFTLAYQWINREIQLVPSTLIALVSSLMKWNNKSNKYTYHLTSLVTKLARIRNWSSPQHKYAGSEIICNSIENDKKFGTVSVYCLINEGGSCRMKMTSLYCALDNATSFQWKTDRLPWHQLSMQDKQVIFC